MLFIEHAVLAVLCHFPELWESPQGVTPSVGSGWENKGWWRRELCRNSLSISWLILAISVF